MKLLQSFCNILKKSEQCSDTTANRVEVLSRRESVKETEEDGWKREGKREEEEGRKEEGGREDIRTEADKGRKRKNLWEGKEGEILIWRGKRERQRAQTLPAPPVPLAMEGLLPPLAKESSLGGVLVTLHLPGYSLKPFSLLPTCEFLFSRPCVCELGIYIASGINASIPLPTCRWVLLTD